MSEYMADRRAYLKQDSAKLDKLIDANSEKTLITRRSRVLSDLIYTYHFSKQSIDGRAFLNIGPGSFQHKNWRTADKTYGDDEASWTLERRGIAQKKPDYSWDLLESLPIEECDDYFEVIYTSHVIEHFFDKDVRFMFSEAYRVLKPGGVFRVVCPDAGLFAEAYLNEDWSFFLNYLYVKTGRVETNDLSISDLAKSGYFAKFILSFFSLLTERENDLYLDDMECIDFIRSKGSIYAAFDEASKLSSRELNKKLGAHVNWFNINKLLLFLQGAGFRNIRRSGYLQSQCAILRDGTYFDKTDPEMSLFFEVVK